MFCSKFQSHVQFLYNNPTISQTGHCHKSSARDNLSLAYFRHQEDSASPPVSKHENELCLQSMNTDWHADIQYMWAEPHTGHTACTNSWLGQESYFDPAVHILF